LAYQFSFRIITNWCIGVSHKLFVKEYFDCFCGGGGRTQNGGAGQVPSAFGIFGAHKMACTCAFVAELSGGGNLKPFFQAFVRFLLRHFNWFLSGYGSASAETSPLTADKNREI
jgi:hypothetical protein